MKILGISAYYHDSAACLLVDGEIISAAQEERFTRKKHDPSFPKNAINYCLSESEIDSLDIDYIVFYEKPFLKFERLLETYLAFAPKGFKSFILAIPVWLKEKLFQKRMLKNSLNEIFGPDFDYDKKLLFSEHHLSHAASAFFPSPFQNAAVLTMDAVGEWTTTSLAIGNDNDLCVVKEILFPHSLGLLYSAFTYYTGFRVNSGEYKLMGLAPYGEPIYVDIIKNNLVDIKADGTFFLNIEYFDFCTGLTMTNKKFHDLFNGEPRDPESEVSQKDMDLAASIQVVTEEIVIKLAKNIAKATGEENLCLAGGVALNCVANGKLLEEKIFKNIWIQPAAGDAGGALGAALSVHYIMMNHKRDVHSHADNMKGSYLGPKFSNDEIEKSLIECGAIYKKVSKSDAIEKTVEGLVEGRAIGWMNGRMEFGPRALGGRSIIADPRLPNVQKNLNLKVKFRESFRPFAPSVLNEEANKWFDIKEESPYMLLVAKVSKHKRKEMSDEQQKLFGIEKLNIPRSDIPAVTHVDYTARVQTVHQNTNPDYYALIKEFYDKTGCPVIVNTSFNVRGEPIVCTPEDAFNCFMGTGLEMLTIENFLLYKEEQSEQLKTDYSSEYELD
ncbi:carbamoyltransferase [Gammaproteobacteria bacterium]|nr:carbamoyltransferase [Gammaproteobacteria bacterium]